MREIKFRGYSIEDDKWVFGDLLQYRVFPVILDDIGEQYECDARSIGQYTGMKDRNGTEIYEGDIVLFDGYRGGVEFSDETGTWIIKEEYYWTDLYEYEEAEIEIIGNVIEGADE